MLYPNSKLAETLFDKPEMALTPQQRQTISKIYNPELAVRIYRHYALHIYIYDSSAVDKLVHEKTQLEEWFYFN
jgi:hypothetical protein